MARTSRGERTTAEILEAARAHLLEAGLEGFSLREVARRADLAPSALYNHFENREALINALAMEAIRQLGGYLEEVPDSLSARERLCALGEAYLRFAASEPQRYRLVFDMLASPTPDWAEYATVAYPFSLIIDAVRAGLDDGEIVDLEGIGASGIAYGLWALVHGFVMLTAHHLANITDDLTGFQRAAISAHVSGLAPSSDTGKARR